MRRLVLTAAAVVGLAATASPASAQFNRTVIRDSGNGANNQIVVRNGPGIPLHAPPAFGGGYGGPYTAGYGPGAVTDLALNPGFVPQPAFGGFGGVNRNFITNSGNGVGNTIIAKNGGGFGYGGHFPGGGVFPGGVNINVVSNSGNGVGNTVVAGNGRPGGLNINVVANSGNGAGNTIITRNR